MKRLLGRLGFGLLFLLLGLAIHDYLSLPDVSPLKRLNPKTTAFMELRDAQARRIGERPTRRQQWLSYGAIAEHLKKAVILSEDAAFFSHAGIDFRELREALKRDWRTGRLERGGSTITMQLAKNLYLSPAKNPWRKIKEVLIAKRLEQKLTKSRIFELYLNLVEWGPGIYGAEAAARHYFAKSAADLEPAEAATLAALLPNPRNPRPPALLHRRNLILNRMAKTGHIGVEEFERFVQTPLFRGESPRDETPLLPAAVGKDESRGSNATPPEGNLLPHDALIQ
jgi:monofunctional biosynthetic peptidoglycan transglycosylase